MISPSLWIPSFLIISFVSVDCLINTLELKCLVCKSALLEMMEEVNKLDPKKKVDVGSFRLDVDGNLVHDSVSQTKSEIQLSEIADGVCNRMDDYIRAKWKSNGTLTLVKLVTPEGHLNPAMSEVDVIQDDDLNKSLKYYCEDVFEEYEETIIQYFQNSLNNIDVRICSETANLCHKSLPTDHHKNEL